MLNVESSFAPKFYSEVYITATKTVDSHCFVLFCSSQIEAVENQEKQYSISLLLVIVKCL